MAILNQNWERMDGDFITLKFTVIDNTNISSYRAWFGVSAATDEADFDTADILVRHTGTSGAPGGTTSPSWLNFSTNPNCSPSIQIPTTYTGIDMEPNFLVIHIGYAPFEDGNTGNTLFPDDGGWFNQGLYRYELVLSPTGDQCSSMVAADGYMDVNESLFQSQGYRGTY